MQGKNGANADAFASILTKQRRKNLCLKRIRILTHLLKEWITGYSYEPWHYRYVGTDVAKIIYEEGITYEEYWAKYISVNEFR